MALSMARGAGCRRDARHMASRSATQGGLPQRHAMKQGRVTASPHLPYRTGCFTRLLAPRRLPDTSLAAAFLARLGIDLPSRLARLLHRWKACPVARVTLLFIGNKVLHHQPSRIEKSKARGRGLLPPFEYERRRVGVSGAWLLCAATQQTDPGNDNVTIAVVSFFLARRHFALSALSWLSSADAISFGNCAA